MNLTLKDIEDVQRQIDELKAQIEDKFKDLKQAFTEGAIIEYRKDYPWDVTINPTWWTDYEYRIKDDISISSWQAHKDLIKQWGDGAEIEVKISKDNWASLPSNPNWNAFKEYRIKPNAWKLPEYEDGSRWAVSDNLQIGEWTAEYYTKAGRRRASVALAERCAKASKERDLLEAYRDYLEPDWKPDWTCPRYDKFYIGRNYDKKDGEYYINNADGCQTIGAVYMSKETAIQICDALNLGKISLNQKTT